MKKLFNNKKSIYNPFVYIAGEKALLTGMTVIILSAFVGNWSNTWLDGILDMHYGPPAPFTWHLAMGLINWLCLVLVLTPLAYILTDTRIRFVDLAGTLALARFPMLFAVLTGFFKAPARVSEDLLYRLLNVGEPVNVTAFDYGFTVLLGLLVILMIVWQVALSFNAYKMSANLSGTRAGISFSAGFVVAYIISKALIWWGQKLVI
ncbi:MAG: hypothetical protein EA394_10010 [Bacteroidia bacterium]|nr:MAG: hypothetical protein EA394_10010 [Bacteroidia bacterium]